MEHDIRNTELFKTLHADALRAWRPGSGLIAEASDVRASPDSRRLCFTAKVADKLEGTPGTRLCIVDVDASVDGVAARIVTASSGSQHGGRWSPDGGRIAFLSDRECAGNSQLHLLTLADGLAQPGPQVGGFVESLQWHQDGLRLLLGVAGLGADFAGAQGGSNADLARHAAPAWAPEVHAGASENEWRRAWVADLAGARAMPASPQGLNVWESSWCGPDAIVASVSDAPEEGAWYVARVVRMELEGGEVRELYQPKHQLGALQGSPSGRHAAVIEAICSDRTIVAGDIVLIDTSNGDARRLDAAGTDVTHVVWQGEDRLLFAGHRSFETVLGSIDTTSAAVEIWWTAQDKTFGNGRCPEFDALVDQRVATVVEGFAQAPAVAIVSREGVRSLLEIGSREVAEDVRALLASATPTRWTAQDGLEIHGWLLVPHGEGPHPTVLEVHGGPVWQFRCRWLGSGLIRPALLRAGYAQFLVNPRGSSGRGQDFASHVSGDMGGADTQDYLSGLDALEVRGIADARNLFVWGGSYGGYMSSWLVTQDRRFAAAVPMSPVTNWVSHQLTSQIPEFCELFLADSLENLGGRHLQRSPVAFASRVTTPVLNVCGALDRNTPPGQALEFHTALRQHGRVSALVTYPQEGHGVRGFPASIDLAARLIGWFERYRRPCG